MLKLKLFEAKRAAVTLNWKKLRCPLDLGRGGCPMAIGPLLGSNGFAHRPICFRIRARNFESVLKSVHTNPKADRTVKEPVGTQQCPMAIGQPPLPFKRPIKRKSTEPLW